MKDMKHCHWDKEVNDNANDRATRFCLWCALIWVAAVMAVALVG